ncbi:DUF2690 domain-containing protein [Streptomyces lavendulae]|uniref:DUF2690 domain-containing protein n=1 Tax=Streptomyces lavendulae TaxID=1914 RepID=UPI003809BACA
MDTQPHSGVQGSKPTSAPAKELGQMLKQWRLSCGWKQSLLGKKVNASQTTVSRWEKGAPLPSIAAINAVWQECAQGNPKLTTEQRDQALALHERAVAEQAESTEQSRRQRGAGEPDERTRRTRKWLAVLGAVAILGVGAAVWMISDDESPAAKKSPSVSASPIEAGPSVAPTATCTAASCASLEPATTVCTRDAVTAHTGREYGALIELRYSPGCKAAWAKMSNTTQGDRVMITPKDGKAEEYRQQYGHDAHTRMVPASRPEDVRACAVIQDRGTICATTP